MSRKRKRSSSAARNFNPIAHLQARTVRTDLEEEKLAQEALRRARKAIREGDEATGIMETTEALKLDPVNLDAIILQAKQLHEPKYYQAAMFLFEQAIVQGCEDVEVFVAYAELCTKQNKLKHALSAMRRALQLNPSNTNYMRKIAAIYGSLKMYEYSNHWSKRAMSTSLLRPLNLVEKPKLTILLLSSQMSNNISISRADFGVTENHTNNLASLLDKENMNIYDYFVDLEDEQPLEPSNLPKIEYHYSSRSCRRSSKKSQHYLRKNGRACYQSSRSNTENYPRR